MAATLSKNENLILFTGVPAVPDAAVRRRLKGVLNALRAYNFVFDTFKKRAIRCVR